MARWVTGYVASVQATIWKQICASSGLLGFLERSEKDLAAVIDHATANPDFLPLHQRALAQNQLREVRKALLEYSQSPSVLNVPREKHEEHLIELLATADAISKHVIPLNVSAVEHLEIIATQLMDFVNGAYWNYVENKDLSRGDRQILVGAIIGLHHLYRVIALDEPTFEDHNLGYLCVELFDSIMSTWSLLVAHLGPQPFKIVGELAVKAVHEHTAWLRRAAKENEPIVPFGWVCEQAEHGFFGRHRDISKITRTAKRRYTTIDSIDVRNVPASDTQETSGAAFPPNLAPGTPGEVEGAEALLSLSLGKAVVSSEVEESQVCERGCDEISHAMDEISSEHDEEKENKEVVEKLEQPTIITAVAAAVADVTESAVRAQDVQQYKMTETDTEIVLDFTQAPVRLDKIVIAADSTGAAIKKEQGAAQKSVLPTKAAILIPLVRTSKFFVPNSAGTPLPATYKTVLMLPKGMMPVTRALKKVSLPTTTSAATPVPRGSIAIAATAVAAGKLPTSLVHVEEHHDTQMMDPTLLEELFKMADMTVLGAFEGPAVDGFVAPKPTSCTQTYSVPRFSELTPLELLQGEGHIALKKKGLKSLLLRLLKVGGKGMVHLIKAVKAALKAIRRAARRS